jgi:hypothetical protein
MISLLRLLKETLIDEGGNVFGTTSSIKKEYIKPTLEKFITELKRIYPKVNFKFSTLGSVGKKDESGDIDLGMSVDQFMTKDNEPLLTTWNIDKGEFDALYEKIRKNFEKGYGNPNMVNNINSLKSDSKSTKLPFTWETSEPPTIPRALRHLLGFSHFSGIST